MIVVKIELHSAITGQVSELGRMIIANDGTDRSHTTGNYNVRLGRKGVVDNSEIYNKPQRKGKVLNHRRLALSIWVLVAKALKSVKIK